MKWYVYGSISYTVDYSRMEWQTKDYVKPKTKKHHLRPANNYLTTQISSKGV